MYAVRWNGTAWVALGPAVPAGDSPAGQGGAGRHQQQRRRVVQPRRWPPTPSGQLALAWEEESATGDRYVWVRVWNGVDAWNELAGSASGSGFTPARHPNVLPQIAVDTSGPTSGPVVAWEGWADQQAAPQIFVLRWNGTDAWEELGLDSASDDGISAAALEAFSPALALTPSPTGVPTVAWLDARDPGSAQVLLRQFYVGPTFPLTIDGERRRQRGEHPHRRGVPGRSVRHGLPDRHVGHAAAAGRRRPASSAPGRARAPAPARAPSP